MTAWLAKLGRGVGLAVAGLLVLVLAVLGWAILSPSPPPARPPLAAAPSAKPEAAQSRPGGLAPGGCGGGSERDQAASLENAGSVDGAWWAPFGRPERGWRTYAALVQREIGAACPPDSPGFAHALAAWRVRQGLEDTGALDETAFRRMSQQWLLRRPFLQAMRRGCPPSPPVESLEEARPAEGYVGKQVALLAPALAAYRDMVAHARAESPQIAADPRLLTIFSAYRGPAEEATRCANGGCNRLTRASCSAHRTGAALDLYLGAAPGSRPESSDDANRRFQAESPAYLWLVANAGRFGFSPYPFEPWHWEWDGGRARGADRPAPVSLAAQRTPPMKDHSAR